MTCNKDTSFWQRAVCFTPKCIDKLLISLCHAQIQVTQSLRQQNKPKTSLRLLFFPSSVNIRLVWFTKKLSFCFISPKHILLGWVPCQHGFCPVWHFGVFLLEMQSFWVLYHAAHFHSDSDGWLLKTEPEDHLASIIKCFPISFLTIRTIISKLSPANFPLSIISRGAGYSSMGVKPLNNIGISSHSGTFFLMSSDHALVSHVQCDAQNCTRDEQSESISPFKLAAWMMVRL